MSAWNRLKVVGVMFAITILVLSILDGFFSIDVDIYHCNICLILLFAVFWFVAPWVGKYFEP